MSSARVLVLSETVDMDLGIQAAPDKKPVQGLLPKALYRLYVH